MNKKAVINFFQNLTLIVLTFTAILLLTKFPMLDGVLSGRVQELLSAPDNTVQSSFDLDAAITAVHFAVTDDSEYGRYTEINAATDGAGFMKLSPLLRAAIGSATTGRSATQAEFRTALETPSVYVDLMMKLPLSVVAAWLGETFSGEENIRALALTTAQETAKLFLLLDNGAVMRYECALSSSAVREVTAAFAPNAGRFAYESGYSSLAPYTILVQQVADAERMNASIPAGYSAYNLLTALDFNAHTNARYTESGGTEVIIQSPRVLRVGPDGVVRYSGDGDVSNELYRIAREGDAPDAVDALRGACRLASALSEGTDAAAMSLDEIKKTERGWIISFCYRLGGMRVRLGGERAALRVTITGEMITEFEYFCRAYTSTEEFDVLLPASMAVAIASTYENAELTMAYVDNGSSEMRAQWFAQ